MDEFDMASELEEHYRKIALNNARNVEKHRFSGFCSHCNAPISEGRFCDTDCRDDFELEAKIKGIKGFR